MYHFGFKKTIDYFQRRRMTKRKIKEQVGDKTKKIELVVTTTNLQLPNLYHENTVQRYVFYVFKHDI